MYYNDHSPAHFHAGYAGDEAIVALESLSIIEGELSPRILALVLEWASQHRDELIENWECARRGLPLNWIAPLA